MSCQNVLSLELRRLHLDLIFCYKVVFGLVYVNFEDFFFTFSLSSQTKGQPYKLYKSCSTNAVHRIFFIDIFVNVWNLLLSIVNFTSRLTFQSSLNSGEFTAYLKCSA